MWRSSEHVGTKICRYNVRVRRCANPIFPCHLFCHWISFDRLFSWTRTIDELPFAQRTIGSQIKLFVQIFDNNSVIVTGTTGPAIKSTR